MEPVKKMPNGKELLALCKSIVVLDPLRADFVPANDNAVDVEPGSMAGQ